VSRNVRAISICQIEPVFRAIGCADHSERETSKPEHDCPKGLLSESQSVHRCVTGQLSEDWSNAMSFQRIMILAAGMLAFAANGPATTADLYDTSPAYNNPPAFQ
jgi:hypothetical protein